MIELFKRNLWFLKQLYIKNEINLAMDDFSYKKNFENTIGPSIYESHLNDYLLCCAFCMHIRRGQCHEYCFICSKKTYDGCSNLLPGTYSFASSYIDQSDNVNTPWIFKTPCTGFERLQDYKYFRNFQSTSLSVTVENYEAIEGIFTGISTGKRPCHICASVNIDDYNNCSDDEKNTENIPCEKIIKEISKKYKFDSGMIRCIE